MIGRTLGDFVVKERLGEGGQGVVYRAEQPALGREAVVKVIQTELREADLVQRFLREARLASRLDHPYAAHVYAFGAEPDGLLWIAMELVRGTPLDRVLAAQGPMPLERFVPFFERLCEVVHTAHEQGIVHRDLKPANIMVIARAGRVMPKLLDLGVAKVAEVARAVDDTEMSGVFEPGEIATSMTDGGLTRRGEIVGSPRYMAPEQWMNRTIDARTDVYALGIVAYETLTGRRPFAGETMRALAKAHAKQPVPPLGNGLPPAVDETLGRAMAKKPGDRFVSAIDLAAGLRAASGLETDKEALPRLDEETRGQVLTDAPQPLADAVALLDEARNGHQARDAVWEVVSTLCHLLGVLALASRSRLAKGEENELLLALTRRSLSDAEWLELARQLCRPYARERDAFPLPELVGFVIDGAGELEALATAERGASFSEAQLRPILTQQMATLGRVLRAVAFLADYRLVSLVGDRAEAWVGTRRAGARVVELTRGSEMTDGSFLVDAPGRAILRLSPLVQRAAPTPGAHDELFLFAGRGRRGARLLALPRGFERTDEDLWPWFREHLVAAADEGGGAPAEETPYRGLAAFTRDDAARFFGREAESDAFRNRLRVTPLLAVVGPSGAGKSSFVEAGVVPGLGPEWLALRVRPGATPSAALDACLDAAGLPSGPTPGDRLRARAAPTLLIVDQCEELFTLSADPDARLAYARTLVDCARAVDEPVRVVLTLRDDFLVRATELAPFRDRIGQGLQILTVPAHSDLLRILTLPAERAGYRFEDADLPERMVEAVADRPGALALLSFTAARLWELRDRHFKQLPRKAYEAIGGVAGALAQHAESVREAMPPAEQRLLREAFRALVTAEGTRAVLSRAELHEVLGDTDAASRVIDRLVDARLLVTSETESGATVEIIHEALLSAWPRLVIWRQEDAEGARLRDQLRAAARQWDERGRAAGLLWRDDALAEYQRWRARYPGQISAVEAAFGDASIAEGRRGRRNRRALLVGIMASLTVALVVVLLLNRRATQARAAAEETAVRLVEDQGRQYMLADDPMRALPYLAEAHRLGARSPALAFLFGRAERLLSMEERVFPHPAPVHQAVYADEGRRVVTFAEDKRVRIWNAATGRLEATFDEIEQMAVSPTGDTIALARLPVRVSKVRVEPAGKEIDVLARDGEMLALTWSPDGRWLAASAKDGWVALVNAADGATRFTRAIAGTPRRLLVVTPDLLVIGTEKGAIHLVRRDGHDSLLQESGERISSLSYAESSQRLAWTTRRTRVSVWDLGKGALLGELSGHEEGPHSSVIAPDGSLVATLSYSSAPQLRQLDPPQTVLALEGHRAVIDSLAFDHLGRLVVTASRDATVRVWDRRTGLALSVLRGHTAAVSAVEFRPDDQRLLTASRDGTARQWLTRPADVRASFPMHRGTIFSIDVTPDGRAVSGSRDKTVARFHAATGKMESRMSFEDPVGSVDLTNDGSRLLVATMQKVKLMDASGTTLAEKTLDRAYWRAVLLSPSEVLLGDGEGAIHWWDGVTTRKVREHHSAIQTLLFDEATGHVISGSEDAAIVWTRDLQVRTVVRDDQPMRGAAMDRAATRLITASASGSPKVWGLPGGALQRRLEGHNYGQWTGLFLHETLAATSGYDESMNVWDAATGKLLAAIPLNGQNVASITLFGEDLLLAGAENGEIWLFDLGLSHAEDWSKRAGCLSPYRLTGDKFVLAARECEPGTEDAIPGGGGRE